MKITSFVEDAVLVSIVFITHQKANRALEAPSVH